MYAFIIFGWRTRHNVLQVGRTNCPSCGCDRDFQHLESRLWFTLFFIPVLPLNKQGEAIRCLICGAHYPIDPNQNAGKVKPEGSSKKAIWAFVCLLFSTSAIAVPIAVFALLLIAIVLAHLSLGDIRRSRGALSGRGPAIATLILAYGTILLSLAAAFITNLPKPVPHPQNATAFATQTADSRLNAIESEVMTDHGEGPATGNNTDAKRLAKEYSDTMLAMSKERFTRTREPLLEISGGKFLTHCELGEDSCLFVVHVPSYRKYEDDAKEVLAKAAWKIGDELASQKISKGDRSAVALRGTILYGDIIIGTVGQRYQTGAKNHLLAFIQLPKDQSIQSNQKQPTPQNPTPQSPQTPSIVSPDSWANPTNIPQGHWERRIRLA